MHKQLPTSNNHLKSSKMCTRRQFLRTAAAGMGAAFVMSGCGPIQSGPTAHRKVSAHKPNVIVIYTDDQGTMDMGCYGSSDLMTPYSDALAKRGIRFTQMYAPSPICSPSRAGLLTGRYPHRAGVPGNVSSQPGVRGMLQEQITMADTFRAAGYATAHIGKWHLGYTEDTMPNAQGFDHSFGHMGGCIDNFSHFFYWAGPNRHDLWRNGKEVFYDGQYFPDLMVNEASRFITANKDKAFFMYYALNTPHYPYQPDTQWLGRYQKAGVPYPRDLYGAFISSQDERIGRLLSHLDNQGLRENTIIILQSDHGHSTEDRAHRGGGSAGIYRGAKFSLFEGGIRVPSIISWPGKLPENTTCDAMVHTCDWLPTLATLCGIRLLDGEVDGKDIAPALNDPQASSPHKVLHWRLGEQWAVREGNWKLIGNAQIHGETLPQGDRNLFLSNLEEDPSERINFAKEYPGIVERLTELAGDNNK